MPNYKFTYFAVRGKGEFIRQLFALAEVEFEDDRFSLGPSGRASTLDRAKWGELKKTTHFGQLPVLKFDGKQLAQANAIAKFLGAEFGFNGSNAYEAALIDSIGIAYDDLFKACRPFYLSWHGVSEESMDDAYKTSVEPGRDKFFPAISKFLGNSKSGFIVGEKISWIDLLVADHCETFIRYNAHYLDKYPEVKAHMEKVHSIPAIKKWIQTRPDTEI
ncbi:unnamed protein product, partial [Mesorhabditis belari]|uniref:glutathione transferase n=1 Tax=Mesorhabditis belari TaxID=2138241 RepID=A0AAF3J8V9_9BILA